MGLQRRQFVLLISRSRLESGWSHNGALHGRHVSRLDPERWSSTLAEGFAPLDSELQDHVGHQNALGAPAAIFYEHEETVAGVFSCAASGSGVRPAALLALGDMAAFTLVGNPHDATLLGRDRAGEARQSHVLIAGDRAPAAERVCALAERAGLVVSSITPIDAALHARVFARATSDADPGSGTTLVLRIGEHASIIAAGTPGRLVLQRNLGIGRETLVTALTRPMGGAPDRAPATARIDHARACTLLERVGVPAPDDECDAELGLTGRDLLPVLQPAIQRCVVELRQSLRFGLRDADRERVALTVMGPGASVPRLAEILAQQAELTLAGVEPGDDLTDAAAKGSRRINLLPPQRANSALASKAKRALIAGTAAAVAVLLGDAGLTLMAVRGLDAQHAAHTASVLRAEELEARREDALQATADLGRMARAAQDALGPRPDWGAVLAEVARLTPEGVVCTDIEAVRQDGAPALTLRGYLLPGESGGPPPDVAEFAGALSASPLFGRAAPGGVHRTTVDGRDASRFTLTAPLVAGPFELAGAGEGTP